MPETIRAARVTDDGRLAYVRVDTAMVALPLPPGTVTDTMTVAEKRLAIEAYVETLDPADLDTQRDAVLATGRTGKAPTGAMALSVDIEDIAPEVRGLARALVAAGVLTRQQVIDALLTEMQS